MANPTLNWRYVGTLTFVSSISNALDAAYALGTAVTYADGSARVPGTGSAWTWAREVSGVTVAAYGIPPVNALSFNFIIGGTSGASAYTFLSPDSATLANCIVYGMNRSSGAYTTWTSATPFTNAGFSGYWRGTRAFGTLAYDSVAMWESQEGCILQFGNAAAGSTATIGLGALLDPLSMAALNAEADGRLYSMFGSGSSLVTSGTWASVAAGTDGTAWAGSSANGGCHMGTFAPGTNVMFGGAGGQTYRFGTFTPSTTFTSTNGDIARVPLSAWNGSTTFFGQSRQWYLTKDSISRLTWTNGATVIGYIWSSSLTTANDAVVMTY
jgi:hypothetical protein